MSELTPLNNKKLKEMAMFFIELAERFQAQELKEAEACEKAG